MSALAQPEVGAYLNRHFLSAFQKVATFQIQNQQKQGGNVASYFCTPQGHVLHAIAGPVDGDTFLREARWANETFDLALLENRTTLDQLRPFFRKAHLARWQSQQNPQLHLDQLPPPTDPSVRALGRLLDLNGNLNLENPSRVHLLLAVAPLPRLDQLYRVVFEKILNEKISTNPVAVDGR